MALGIACAGTGLREAIALLEPLAKFDPVNFVRQGALVCINKCICQCLGRSSFFPFVTSPKNKYVGSEKLALVERTFFITKEDITHTQNFFDIEIY